MTTTIKKTIGFLSMLLLLSASGYGQQFENEKYDWEKDRSLFKLTPEEEKESVIVLKNYKVMESAYSDEKESQLYLFTTVHKIIKVNSDDAIEDYNKVYISMSNVVDILNIKARTISPKGKTVDFNKENIKELKNVEDAGDYKIFALEGVEKGSEIEYFYTLKSYFNAYGRETLQSSEAARNVYYCIITPKNLVFTAKGYNGLPAFSDTAKNEKNFLSVSMDYIPSLKDEGFATYKPNLMRFEYKLDANKAQGKSQFYTYSQAAQNIYKYIHTVNSKEVKAAESLAKKLKLSSLPTDAEKIKKLEDYLKTTVSMQEHGQVSDEINIALENKYTSEGGLVKIYAAVLGSLNIAYEIVLTSDRNVAKFDKDFENYNFLSYYLIYFPGTKQYLAPSQPQYRYGMVPFYWTNNDGLFIKEIAIGDSKTGLGKIKFIPALEYNKSADNLYITAEFFNNNEQLKVDIKKEMTGYYGSSMSPYYPFLTDEQKVKLKEELMRAYVKDAVFKELEVTTTDFNSSTIDVPFVMNAKMESSVLIEKAGKKSLFKIGEIIGPQAELYQDEQRKLNVENDFNRGYLRVIKFKIPDNMVVKNLDDLKMDIFCEEEGQRVYEFKSTYVVENNWVTVNVIENYKLIDYPLSKYESYRKVINAAADFNKIVLVLE